MAASHGRESDRCTPEHTATAGTGLLATVAVGVVMITGDNERTAHAVARQVGIDRVLADVLPDQNAAEVRRLQDEGKLVAMVGDGINDSPALAQADVGVAIGTGPDVAIEAADVTLMSGELRGLVTAIGLSKATMRKRQAEPGAGVRLQRGGDPGRRRAALPVTGALLSPLIAAAAMAISSISVVLNSAHLNRFRPPLMQEAPAAARQPAATGSR